MPTVVWASLDTEHGLRIADGDSEPDASQIGEARIGEPQIGAASTGGLRVVAVAASVAGVRRAIAWHRPDVVVLDMRLRGAARLVARRSVAVLALVTSDSELLEAMRAGARGCVLTSADAVDIANAVHAVAAGEVVFGPCAAARLGELVCAGEPFQPPDRTVAITRAMAATFSRLP